MSVYIKTQQIKSPSGKTMKSQAQSTQDDRNSATRVGMSESVSQMTTDCFYAGFYLGTYT
jgi:hypothetical protein